MQICSGECLTWIDGNDYCFPGLLSKTFKTPEGCDSVVQQMVTLLPPIINNLGTIFLCENECIEINGNNYCWPGFNTEIATSNIPPYCDSTILFNIVQVLPDAEIDAFPSTEITCNNSQITLSSIGISIPSGSVQYNWLLNGFPYSNTPNINTSTSGNYTLIIQNSLGTTTCFDTADITITQNIIPPSISLNAPILPCTGSIVIDLSTNATNVSYQWSGPDINTTNQNLQDPAISLPGTYFVTVTNTTNGCTNSASINITQTQGGTANISSFLDASCSNTCDGIATANITGGVAPYSYNWSGPTPQTSSTAVNLCPGSYTVSITDNQGCVATANVNIGSPLALSFTESIVDEKCNQENGEICISNVSGGTSPYYFNWTGFASTDTCLGNLGSGDYYLTIFDENNCSISDTFILENIAGPTIQASINQEISCYNACDGILTVNVNGGTAPYIYNWNDPLSQTNQQINNICSGNYIITVTDIYNCYATDTIQLNQPDSFSINTSTINADCNTPNGQACVYVSGGTPPYLYLWNDINAQTANCANGLLPGIYEVQITDQNNCSKTVTVTVNANNAAIVNVLNTSNNLCFNSCDGTLEAIATGGTPPL